MHGVCKGGLLALWRILRCNPFGKNGVDYVPPPGRWRSGIATGAAENPAAAPAYAARPGTAPKDALAHVRARQGKQETK